MQVTVPNKEPVGSAACQLTGPDSAETLRLGHQAGSGRPRIACLGHWWLQIIGFGMTANHRQLRDENLSDSKCELLRQRRMATGCWGVAAVTWPHQIEGISASKLM